MPLPAREEAESPDHSTLCLRPKGCSLQRAQQLSCHGLRSRQTTAGSEAISGEGYILHFFSLRYPLVATSRWSRYRSLYYSTCRRYRRTNEVHATQQYQPCARKMCRSAAPQASSQAEPNTSISRSFYSYLPHAST